MALFCLGAVHHIQLEAVRESLNVQLQVFRNSRGRPGGDAQAVAAPRAEIDVKWTLHFRTLSWLLQQASAAAESPTAFSELTLRNAKVGTDPPAPFGEATVQRSGPDAYHHCASRTQND